MAIELLEFSEILNELTGGQAPLCTLKELGFVMGVDYQTVWGYRAGNTEPRWKDVVRLSHYLIKEHGYYKLGMQPTLTCCVGKSDGRVSDDLMNLYEAGTDLHRAFKEKNKTESINALARMEAELKDLKAEVIAI